MFTWRPSLSGTHRLAKSARSDPSMELFHHLGRRSQRAPVGARPTGGSCPCLYSLNTVHIKGAKKGSQNWRIRWSPKAEPLKPRMFKVLRFSKCMGSVAPGDSSIHLEPNLFKKAMPTMQNPCLPSNPFGPSERLPKVPSPASSPNWSCNFHPTNNRENREIP